MLAVDNFGPQPAISYHAVRSSGCNSFVLVSGVYIYILYMLCCVRWYYHVLSTETSGDVLRAQDHEANTKCPLAGSERQLLSFLGFHGNGRTFIVLPKNHLIAIHLQWPTSLRALSLLPRSQPLWQVLALTCLDHTFWPWEWCPPQMLRTWIWRCVDVPINGKLSGEIIG